MLTKRDEDAPLGQIGPCDYCGETRPVRLLKLVGGVVRVWQWACLSCRVVLLGEVEPYKEQMEAWEGRLVPLIRQRVEHTRRVRVRLAAKHRRMRPQLAGIPIHHR